MENNGYSLADIASVANNDNWGGNGMMYLLLFALIFGGGFGNWGNRGDYGQFATAASQQDILFGQKFSDLDNKIDKIGYGICDSTYALNNSVKDGNNMVAGTVITEGRATQKMLCDINSNIDNKFAQLEKNQMQAQIDAQAQEINRLYIAQQMCGVVRYPNGMSYSAGTSPFCNCNTGCVCGNGNI